MVTVFRAVNKSPLHRKGCFVTLALRLIVGRAQLGEIAVLVHVIARTVRTLRGWSIAVEPHSGTVRAPCAPQTLPGRRGIICTDCLGRDAPMREHLSPDPGRPFEVSRRRALGVLLSWPAGAVAIELPALVTAAKPSLCAVGTYNALDNPRFSFRGTGFAVGDGSLVATCFHVLPQPKADEPEAPRLVVQRTVGPGQFEVRQASPVASDRTHDLAVLKISGPPLPALRLGDPEQVQEGMPVALLGYPIGGRLGFSVVTHRGIVSSIITSTLPPAHAGQLTANAARQLREGAFELLQLDATAYPGNSGGPLLDAATGQVIGIISMVLLKGNRESALTNPSGISYALPARYLAPLIQGR